MMPFSRNITLRLIPQTLQAKEPIFIRNIKIHRKRRDVAIKLVRLNSLNRTNL